MRNLNFRLPGIPLSPLLAAITTRREAPQSVVVHDDAAKPDHTTVQSGAYYLLAEDSPPQAVLSQWLDESDLPPVNQWHSNGGGATVSVGRIVIDAHGSGGGDDYQTPKYEVEAGGGQGSLSVGYLLIDTPFVRVYPLVGLGGTGGGLDLTPEASNNGHRPHQSGWFALLLRGGIGAEFTLTFWRLRLYLTLRAGYFVPVFDVILGEGGDTSRLPRPFFRIALGTGWRH